MIAWRKSAFSPCGEYFVCSNEGGVLTIWETSTNNVKQEYNINSHLNTSCTSLIWGSFENTVIENVPGDNGCQVLIIGTEAGTVYLYDHCSGKLVNHFDSSHTDIVNDFSLDFGTNQLFSCSNDKTVIGWDIISGKVVKKWSTDEEMYSLCVVDSNNLLTGSSSILWWNVKQQSVIKKFICKECPVTLLHAIKSSDLGATTYFLSAAEGESKISAWALSEKNSKTSVASFILPEEYQTIDTNNSFSKENPLLLTATTKSGTLVLFQHVLNGKSRKLYPNMTLDVMSKANSKDKTPSSIPVLSSKILDCAESCIIAYGSQDNPVFESVNIFDCPKRLTLSRENPIIGKVSNDVNVHKKVNELTIINGQTSTIEPLYSSPKKRKQKVTDVESSTKSLEKSIELVDLVTSDCSRSKESSSNVKKKKISERFHSNTLNFEEEYSVHTDPSEMRSSLIKGIEEDRVSLINSVLHCDNSELIRSTVRNFPLHSLNLLLLELHKRLVLPDKRYNTSIRRWLKETLTIHLPYLMTCKDLTEILEKVKKYIDTRQVGETLLKMNMLKGLLKVQLQTSDESESSSNESDSEEQMES